MGVTEPHKELRFTRAAQAVPFWISAAICAAVAILLVSISLHRADNPALPHPAWALLPSLICWASVRAALHCTRKAYLILSPLGVEIFPLLRPVKGMQMVPWGQIDSVEVGDYLITLHFDDSQSSGIHLTLSPIPKAKRPLLAKALTHRIENNRQSAISNPQS
ncbi:hypothetical protein [Haloferula rosea]|uniref:PH domain-containing protein n=1 Tax=Haloferula rosea TaxID=490093 RepID=A0A934VGN4_9BACT|nr:hypothetical protein [Haloferula rosea]MBK1828241.1 hypothetical protein [Haloferula rosea]